MSKLNQIEFANFICRFGDVKVLLDLADEIVVPAFTTDGMQRSYSDTKYFFFQVKLMEMSGGNIPVLAIAGHFVKDTTLKREQIYDKKDGLKPDHLTMPSSPSSIFMLILNNHKLIYLHETANAPNLQAFRSTCEQFIRQKHKEFIDKLFQQKQKEVSISPEKKITKKDLYKETPRPTVEIIPLSSDTSLEQFIKKYDVLRMVQTQLVQTNDELDINEFFRDVRETMEDIGSKQTTLTHTNPAGLSKEEAFRQLSPAAQQGNTRIIMDGKDIQGDKLIGNNDNFKVRVPLMEVGKDLVSTANHMYKTFLRISKIGSIRVAEPGQGATEKIKTLRKRLKGQLLD